MSLKKSYPNYVTLFSLIFLLLPVSSFSMQYNLNSNADTRMVDAKQELWGRCDEKDCSGYWPRKSCGDINHLKLNIHKHYRLKHAKKIKLFHKKFKENPHEFIASSELIKIYNKKNMSLKLQEKLDMDVNLISYCPVCGPQFSENKSYDTEEELISNMKQHYIFKHPEVINLETHFVQYRLFQFFKYQQSK